MGGWQRERMKYEGLGRIILRIYKIKYRYSRTGSIPRVGLRWCSSAVTTSEERKLGELMRDD